MAFGKMIESSAGSSGQSFTGKMPFISSKEGKRVVRFLPTVETRKKNARIAELRGLTQTPEVERELKSLIATPDEVLLGETALHVWMPVKRGGVEVQRRIFVDYSTRSLLPKALNDRISRRFFMNVLDKTYVIKQDGGSLVYPNNQNQFIIEGKEPKTITDQRPVRNMDIMIFEGSVSSGNNGRMGLLNEIEELSKSIYDDATGELEYLTNVDIEIVTRGKGIQTTRAVYVGVNRDPVPEEVFTIPLYDLSAFVKPYPADAVKDLLAGKEYNDVINSYKIVAIPRQITPEQAEAQVQEQAEDELF
jgi:hypothetical protein